MIDFSMTFGIGVKTGGPSALAAKTTNRSYQLRAPGG